MSRQHFLTSAAPCTLAACLLTIASATAQAQVAVNVNAASVLAVVPDGGVGLHTSVYANQFGNAALPGRIDESGVQMLRFPGGSYSDIYHWSTHVASGGYAASQSHFGRFVQIMDQSGTKGMVTVNYGSSLQNTMGGQPKEAAAWVAYANGDASLYNTPADISIGLDAEGNDWRTAGYWANLRASTAAQNPDNQYDRLAINRDAPLGIKYWEVGNELNGNGYYSPQWEYDLHAPYSGGNSSSNVGRANNALLSPTAYAMNFNSFAAAMKAVDPTIKVGAVLEPLGVGNTGNPATNWDRNVLRTAGVNMDFGIIHYYVNNGTSTDAVLNATDDLPGIFNTVRNEINTHVGAGQADRIELHMTEFGYFGAVDAAAIDGVFAANTYITALANRASSVHWLEMSKDSFLGDSAPLSRGAAFYGIQLASQIAQPGAAFVSTSSTSGAIEVNSAVLPDGRIGVFLANVGATDVANVNIVISNAELAASGTRWLYGINQTTPLVTPFAAGLGSSFSTAVPARSVMAYLIDAAPPSADFNSDGAVDGDDFLAWQRGLGVTSGATRVQGDADHDHDVDANDLALWGTAFLAQGGSVGVPEPPAAGLLLLALLAIPVGPAGNLSRKVRRAAAEVKVGDERRAPDALLPAPKAKRFAKSGLLYAHMFALRQGGSVSRTKHAPPIGILFIGNSFTQRNDLPDLLHLSDGLRRPARGCIS